MLDQRPLKDSFLRLTLPWVALVVSLLLGGSRGVADEAEDSRVTRTVRIVQQIEGGVVAVFSQGKNGGIHSGSGSIIHPAGFVLTNDHVVRDRRGFVLRENHRPVVYQTVGRIPEKDLAILRIPPSDDLTVIPVGHSDDLMTGEPCLCGGNPGGRGIVFTSGMISAPAIMMDAPNALVMSQFAQDVRDRFVQFDAASNRGNSGGPLINALGQQIGVVSAKQLNEENINYAIPIDRVRKYAEELIAPEVTRDLFVGIRIDTQGPQARVVEVVPESPAARAGIRPGDVLLQAGELPLRDGLDWLFSLALRSSGDRLPVTFRREEEEQTTTISVEPYPTHKAVEVDDPQEGLIWKLFVDGKLASFPAVDQLQAVDEGVAERLATRNLSGQRNEHFALRFDGFLNVEKSGLHRLILASDDGSRLFLHGDLLIDNDGAHPRRELGAKVRLVAGLHPIRIDYFEATGDSSLELFCEPPGGERVELGEGAFFHATEADSE